MLPQKSSISSLGEPGAHAPELGLTERFLQLATSDRLHERAIDLVVLHVGAGV